MRRRIIRSICSRGGQSDAAAVEREERIELRQQTTSTSIQAVYTVYCAIGKLDEVIATLPPFSCKGDIDPALARTDNHMQPAANAWTEPQLLPFFPMRAWQAGKQVKTPLVHISLLHLPSTALRAWASSNRKVETRSLKPPLLLPPYPTLNSQYLY